tara:strand:+ start:1187 stop:2311 length:1125 start_codon:yes stop_codon:yes gene_type:complete
MKIFYKSIILFWSILLFLSCNSVDDLSKGEDEELIYKYVKHKNNRVASLIMDDVQYNDWVKNNIFKSDVEKVMKLTKDIYKGFPDKYDFIILLLNEYETPKSLETTSATGDGFFKPVSNDINGIGCIIAQCTNPIYSNSYLFGSSEGKLKGVLHLGNRRLIKNGPILHELMHHWGNHALETESVSEFGNNISSFPTGKNNGSHWGFTGGNVNGQLGGFIQSTLKENDDSTYSVDKFQPIRHINNYHAPYNELELYLAGLIPIDSVKDFDVFKNITSFTSGSIFSKKYRFKASSRITYTSESLKELLGKRIPDVNDSQKNFKILLMVISNNILTDEEFNQIDSDTEWFHKKEFDNLPEYNFYEATKGKGSITIGY